MTRANKSNISKQEVLDIIRNKILYLDYKPGESLSDNAIAEELKVSRTPVREALLLLKQEQFVDIFPQSGTFVSLIDVELIKEVLFVRHVLECEIFTQLMKNNIPLRRSLDRYLVLQELAVSEGSQKDYIENDHLFHKEIFRAAGHMQSWELIEDMYKHTIRFHALDFIDSRIFGTSLQEHKEILDCYESGDHAKLMQLLDIHHDCGLRTSEELMARYPGYFRH